MQAQYNKMLPSQAERVFPAGSIASAGQEMVGFRGLRVRPNPSIERTRTGRPLQALILFWALRALPVQAAHVKR